MTEQLTFGSRVRQKMPTWDQIKGIMERLILIGLAGATAAGWIGEGDAETYGPAVLLLIGSIYAWWVNRPKAIVQSAAALPGTVVVTTPDLAKSTPEPNIVSNITSQVELKGDQQLAEEEITRELNRTEAARH